MRMRLSLVLFGRPAERITDLRQTETVVRAGRTYSARALYESIGVRRPDGRPDK